MNSYQFSALNVNKANLAINIDYIMELYDHNDVDKFIKEVIARRVCKALWIAFRPVKNNTVSSFAFKTAPREDGKGSKKIKCFYYKSDSYFIDLENLKKVFKDCMFLYGKERVLLATREYMAYIAELNKLTPIKTKKTIAYIDRLM